MSKRMCELYDRECIDCGECEFCDLDPTKICDNCGKCLEIKDFASFQIESVDGRELDENNKKSQNSPQILSGKKFVANKKLK